MTILWKNAFENIAGREENAAKQIFRLSPNNDFLILTWQIFIICAIFHLSTNAYSVDKHKYCKGKDLSIDNVMNEELDFINYRALVHDPSISLFER